MPINIPNDLPAWNTLEQENIFIMSEKRASSQDIRPLRILILNLMPKKIDTERQLLRMLSNTPLQVDVELMQTATHNPKNTPQDHLLKFYKTFSDIKDQYFDGMIITGAPVEHLEFEEVAYWPELCEIMEWSKTHVYSTMHICWGAQAGLYYHYGIPKHPLKEKMFGIYQHKLLNFEHKLVCGFDEYFYVPQSRHTTIYTEDDMIAAIEYILATGSDEIKLGEGEEIQIKDGAEAATISDSNGLKGVFEVKTSNSPKDLTNVQATAILKEYTIIKFYKGGVTYYYTSLIKHFGDYYTPIAKGGVDALSSYNDGDHLGRYGVVRNNWYELNIKSVSGPGEPEIPEIPEEPADKEHSYINTEINILSWAKRSQDVEL